jgi:hypothetical protein
MLRDDKPECEVWAQACAVGQPLPAMPLHLTHGAFVPVDFEATYTETCRDHRLT